LQGYGQITVVIVQFACVLAYPTPECETYKFRSTVYDLTEVEENSEKIYADCPN
jgi:hypothetical protein